MDTGVPWQTSQRSVLGLVWSSGCHDKHLGSQFFDWSGHHGTMTNISALSSGTGHQGAMMTISAASLLISLVSVVPQPSSQQSGTLRFLKLLSTCDSCFSYQSIFQSVTDKQVAISLFESRWRCCSWCQLVHTAHTFFSSCFRSSDCGEPQAGGSVCLCGNQHVLWPGPDTTGISAGASSQHVWGKRSSAPQGQADPGWLWRSRGWRWSVGVATV